MGLYDFERGIGNLWSRIVGIYLNVVVRDTPLRQDPDRNGSNLKDKCFVSATVSKNVVH